MRRWPCLLLVGLGVLGGTLGLPACGSDDEAVPPGADAAPEASQIDALGPGDAADAGADVADARDARETGAPGGFCRDLAPKPRFCDDFDDGDLANGWDVSTRAPASSIQDLDDVEFTSAPFSYFAGTKAAGAGGGANVSLRSTMFGTVDHATLSFALRLGTVTFAADGLVAIATLDVSTSHRFTLNLHTGNNESPDKPGPTLEEQVNGMIFYHPLTALPAAGTWTRVKIDLDFTAGKATVSFDGTKALDGAAIAKVPGTETTVRLGAVYVNGPANDFEAGFDDVVVDF
ncbi:MAG: hypothetical protein JWP97_6240 [Labilithrix sp.]|nr:hypothetical protein [Labilithrix sp.]